MDRLSTNGQMLSQVELQKLPHSSFDMANHNFLSGKLGKLIPTRIDEVYPGDTIKGHVQAVANFEPLVGPIMASMVMKQESFYVPLIEVWKNADKFFTAKKGFDTPMPSCSPREVFRAYLSYGLIINPSDLNSSFSNMAIELVDPDTTVAQKEEFMLQYRGELWNYFFGLWNSSRSYGESYCVYDLLQPVFDRVQSEILGTIAPGQGSIDDGETRAGKAFADLISHLSDSEQVRLSYFDLYVRAYTDTLTYIMDYYFGASSLMDYAGWPCSVKWNEYFELWRLFWLSPSNLQPVNIADYFSSIPLNWLRFRALYLCWYWNYRDQLLEQDAYDPESDEFLADTVTANQMILLTLLRVRCWYKDTYTTALTNTGTGNFRVPVEGEPFSYDQQELNWEYFADGDDGNTVLLNTSDYKSAFAAGATIAKVSIGNIEYSVPTSYLGGVMDSGVFGNMSSSTGLPSLSFDLFDRLRRLQSFTEKELLLGYEIDDVVYAHFMVRLSNIRMRIPELLSRGRDEVQINTIVNNTDVPNGQPAGDKTAVAWSQGRTSDISYFSEYWGYFINFLTILPIQSYTGGLDRNFLKLKRFDYAWPDFATIGMDAVYNAELSAPRGDSSLEGLTDKAALAIFGYQGRYYDLKSKKDEEHGRLRTDLNYLTFSREWNSNYPPKLNYIFVHCWPRLDMFVTDDPSVDVIKQIDVYHDIDYHRAFPVPSEYLG